MARDQNATFLNVKGVGSSPSLGISRKIVVLEPPPEFDIQPAESFGKLLKPRYIGRKLRLKQPIMSEQDTDKSYHLP